MGYNHDGLSEQVRAFVNKNRPKEIVVSAEEMKAAAEAAGFRFEDNRDAHPDFAVRDLGFAVLTAWGPETEPYSVRGEGFPCSARVA